MSFEMGSGDFPKGGQYAFEVLAAIRQPEGLRGALYNNIILSSPEPEIIDDYGKDASNLLVRYATLYWPGRSPEHRYNLETFRQGILPPSQLAAEASRIRNAILGASIGQAALDRVPEAIQERWRQAETELTTDPIERIIGICILYSLPLAVCETSEITNDQAGRGMMHLWYPNTIHPQPVLDELKKIVRYANDQEKP